MCKLVIISIIIVLSGCSSDIAVEDIQNYPVVETHISVFQKGIATWYGPGFDGRRTSSGQTYDMYAFTAAHLTLPLGSIIRVTNTNNQRSTIVLVNDRGPVNTSLILDLSKIAANNLDIVRKGSGKVQIEVLSSSENPLQKIFETYLNIGNG